jgi:CRP-like cAMP-binding protein
MDNPIELAQKIDVLKAQECFKKLTDTEIDTLATLLHEVKAKKGQTIVTEGDHVDSVYFIIKGNLDVRHIRVKDGELVSNSVATLHEGEAIGLNESGFYSLTGLRTATVVANTDMVFLKLSVAAFHGFALAYSHVNEVMHHNAKAYIETKN